MRLQQAAAFRELPGVSIPFLQIAGRASNYQMINAITGVLSGKRERVIGMIRPFAFAESNLAVIATPFLASVLIQYLLCGMCARNALLVCVSVIRSFTRLSSTAFSLKVFAYGFSIICFTAFCSHVLSRVFSLLIFVKKIIVSVSLSCCLFISSIVCSVFTSDGFSFAQIVIMRCYPYLFTVLYVTVPLPFLFRFSMRFVPYLHLYGVCLFVGIVVSRLPDKSLRAHIGTHAILSTSRILAGFALVIKPSGRALCAVKELLIPGMDILARWTSLVSLRYIRRFGRYMAALFAVRVETILSLVVLTEDVKRSVLPTLTFCASFHSGKEVGTLRVLRIIRVLDRRKAEGATFTGTFFTSGLKRVAYPFIEVGISGGPKVLASGASLNGGELRYNGIHVSTLQVLASRRGMFPASPRLNISTFNYTINQPQKLVEVLSW